MSWLAPPGTRTQLLCIYNKCDYFGITLACELCKRLSFPSFRQGMLVSASMHKLNELFWQHFLPPHHGTNKHRKCDSSVVHRLVLGFLSEFVGSIGHKWAAFQKGKQIPLVVSFSCESSCLRPVIKTSYQPVSQWMVILIVIWSGFGVHVVSKFQNFFPD